MAYTEYELSLILVVVLGFGMAIWLENNAESTERYVHWHGVVQGFITGVVLSFFLSCIFNH